MLSKELKTDIENLNNKLNVSCNNPTSQNTLNSTAYTYNQSGLTYNESDVHYDNYENLTHRKITVNNIKLNVK